MLTLLGLCLQSSLRSPYWAEKSRSYPKAPPDQRLSLDRPARLRPGPTNNRRRGRRPAPLDPGRLSLDPFSRRYRYSPLPRIGLSARRESAKKRVSQKEGQSRKGLLRRESAKKGVSQEKGQPRKGSAKKGAAKKGVSQERDQFYTLTGRRPKSSPRMTDNVI